jgi:hypothetical protein
MAMSGLQNTRDFSEALARRREFSEAQFVDFLARAA